MSPTGILESRARPLRLVAALPVVCIVVSGIMWFAARSEQAEQSDARRQFRVEGVSRVLSAELSRLNSVLSAAAGELGRDFLAKGGTTDEGYAVLGARLQELRRSGLPVIRICAALPSGKSWGCREAGANAAPADREEPFGAEPVSGSRLVIANSGAPTLRIIEWPASRDPATGAALVEVDARSIFQLAAAAFDTHFFLQGASGGNANRTGGEQAGERRSTLVPLSGSAQLTEAVARAWPVSAGTDSPSNPQSFEFQDHAYVSLSLPANSLWNVAPNQILAVLDEGSVAPLSGYLIPGVSAALAVWMLYGLSLYIALRRQRAELESAEQSLVANRDAVELTVSRRTQALTETNQRLRKEVQERERAEEKTLRHQMFLMTVIDSLPYPFLVVDARDFNVKLANKTALARAVEHVGVRECHSLLHGFDHPCMGADTPCIMKEIYRRKKPAKAEHRVLDAQGKLVIYEVQGYPVFDDQGRLEQIIEYFVDVTDRKRAEQALTTSERNYRELVESANSIVLRWGRNGLITFINGFGLRFFGFAPDELIGQPMVGTILPLRDSAGNDLRDLLRSIVESPEHNQLYETEGRRKDGKRVWISWANKAVRDTTGQIVELLSFGIDVTQRRYAMEALRESEARFRNIYENSLVMMHSMDDSGRIVNANRRWLEETGYQRSEVEGQPLEKFLTAESRSALRLAQNALKHQECIEDAVYHFVRKSGENIDFLMSSNVSKDSEGRRSYLSVLQNISERRRAEQELRLAASVFENSVENILIASPDGRILRVNKTFTLNTDYSADEAIGRTPAFLLAEEYDFGALQHVLGVLAEHGAWKGELTARKRNGDEYPVRLSISTVLDGDGGLQYYIGLFTDITEEKDWKQNIWRMANFDRLTDLPNRELFAYRLDRGLADARRTNSSVPLLYLDLDRFKPVNDSFGHLYGDLLLQQVAVRLRQCLRESDTVARMGGDEFTVVLESVGPIEAAEKNAEHVAAKVLEVLGKPFDLDGREAHISASIGIAIFPRDGRDSAELVRNADTAMYHAKTLRGGSVRIYEPQMHAKAADRLLIENSMRRALLRKEFELFFQPCVRLADGGISSLEALIRWRDPVRGMIPPDHFIRLAEETGLIVDIGEWVLAEALRWLGHWRDAGYRNFRVAVNLSLRQFRHRDMIIDVQKALSAAGMEPTVLALEVTESTFAEDELEVVERLRMLSEMGVEILIDDFGTGYSSLGRLRKLPVHVLKIDRSFVADITNDPNDESIIEAIIAMAHSLQMQVIAEGVQTPEQLAFLEARHCDQVQGFLFRQPIPAEEVLDYLKGAEPRESGDAALSG